MNKKIILTNKINPVTQSYWDWYQIDWRKVNDRVRAVQQEIVKATLANQIKKVYQLQRKCVVMVETRALAVRKVVTNKGGNTPGIDLERWDTP